jgi:osmoprotectant transport system permease protein
VTAAPGASIVTTGASETIATAAATAPAVDERVAVWRRPWRHHRVLLVLVLAALACALALPFVRVSPNRLVTGQAVALIDGLGAWRHALWLPAIALVASLFAPPRRWVCMTVFAGAALALALLVVVAGDEGARHVAAVGASALTRVSLGAGFWCLALLAWLAACDALQPRAGCPGLRLSPAARSAAFAAALLVPMLPIVSGHLDALSLAKEYASRRDAFDDALVRHLQIVLAALLPALAIGVPLGVAASRRPGFARPLFALLNIVQTVPSIALFALLIAPLAAVGLRGVGLAPAAVALTLYALLPIVHGTVAGLAQVSPAAVDAGRGIGMSASQLFWRVRAPLALPVLLSGVRVTTVQLIGLAVVAALIGAGGFGALVFQGLASGAVDLVVLGVLPVVALSVVVDAAFALLAARLRKGEA